jgi:hypothetical protein
MSSPDASVRKQTSTQSRKLAAHNESVAAFTIEPARYIQQASPTTITVPA